MKRCRNAWRRWCWNWSLPRLDSDKHENHVSGRDTYSYLISSLNGGKWISRAGRLRPVSGSARMERPQLERSSGRPGRYRLRDPHPCAHRSFRLSSPIHQARLSRSDLLHSGYRRIARTHAAGRRTPPGRGRRICQQEKIHQARSGSSALHRTGGARHSAVSPSR